MTVPTAPIPKVHLGKCLRSHTTQGAIYVKIRPIPRFTRLSDVLLSNPNDGDVYMWSGANNRFEAYNMTKNINPIILSTTKISGGYIDNLSNIVGNAAFEYIVLKVTPGEIYTYNGKTDGSASIGVIADKIDNTKQILVDGDYSITSIEFEIPLGCYQIKCSSPIAYPLIIIKKEEKKGLVPSSTNDLLSIINKRISDIELFSINESVDSSTGIFTYSLNWIRTDFVKVNKGDILIYTGTTLVGFPITFWDKNKKLIGHYDLANGTNSGIEILIPENVDYIVALAKCQIGDIYSLKFKKTISGTSVNINNGVGNLLVDLQTIASTLSQPFFGSNEGYEIHRPTGSNKPLRYYMIPNGIPTELSGIRTKLELFYTDYKLDSANYSALNILLMNGVSHIGVNQNGTESRLAQIIGGAYIGSGLIENCARIEVNVNDTVDLKGRKYTVHEIFNIKPQNAPLNPIEGDLYYDQTMNKLRCYDGSVWNNLF